MNIQLITLDDEDIAFNIDPHADRLGNAPQIFTVGAEKGIGGLKILKDDLFDRSLSRSRVSDLLFFQI